MPGEPVFINLSNHPSEKWPTNQLSAALRYGKVIDLAFPPIPPEAGSEAVDALVERYLQMILAHGRPVVMVQGEYVFTFRLVTLLKAEGLTALAACTERRAVERTDGDGVVRRVSEFVFSGFRAY